MREREREGGVKSDKCAISAHGSGIDKDRRASSRLGIKREYNQVIKATRAHADYTPAGVERKE